MPSYHATITRAQLEACISQMFWHECRRMLWRHGPPMALVWLLVIWPLTGFSLEAPSAELAAILFLGVAVMAALWVWAWRRMRGEVAAVRRECDELGLLPTVRVPITLAMDVEGIDLRFAGAGEPRPWDTLRRTDETRDFLVIFFGTLPPYMLPKAGFEPEDLAAIRAELRARLAATAS